MSHVNAENIQLLSTIETSPGVAGTAWRSAEPNTIDNYTPDVKKVARAPISRIRAMRKGTITDLDSNPGWVTDLTKDVVDSFIEGVMFSKLKGLTNPLIFVPTAVTATGFTVASGGAIAQNLLFVTRNFGTAANSGLKLAAAASIATEIKCAGLTAEAAPPANVTLEICGVQAGVAADIQMDGSGNITSTALDLTTLGLQVGSWIYLPTAAEALTMGSANFAFANTVYTGFARIRIIAAGKLTLDRRSWVVGGADVAAGKTIRIFFGRWIRNVARDAADYQEITYQYELAYPDLSAPGTPEYEYAIGNYHSKWTISAPLTDKASVKIENVGMSMDTIATARKTGASTAIAPICTEAINTTVSLNRLRFATASTEVSVSQDVQNFTLDIMNNCSGIKVLGQLGPKYINVGKFQVSIQADIILIDDTLIKAVADNRTLSFDCAMRNTDFGVLWDIPAMTVSSADKKFPANQSVLVGPQFDAFNDPVLGYTLGCQIFPFLPTA